MDRNQTSGGFNSIMSQILLYLFPKNCFETIFINYDIFDEECIRAVTSRFLGLAIVAGSVAVKVPQIVKIVKAKTGKGVTLLGSMLEMFAFSATAAYSYSSKFPFSAWGDNLFMSLQMFAVSALMLFFDVSPLAAVLLSTLYAAGWLLILGGMVPLSLLTMFIMVNMPLSIIARGLQIWSNYSNQSTGQLSLVTTLLMFLGSMARVFTSVQDTGDVLMITASLIGVVTNAIILSQILYYWSKPVEKKFV